MNPNTEKVYNAAFDLIEIRLQKKERVLPFVILFRKAAAEPEIKMYEHIAQDTTKQIEIIRSDLRQETQKGNVEALCFCYDMTVTDPRSGGTTDAILIELANEDEGTKNIYIPYNFNDTEVIKKPFQTDSDQSYF